MATRKTLLAQAIDHDGQFLGVGLAGRLGYLHLDAGRWQTVLRHHRDDAFDEARVFGRSTREVGRNGEAVVDIAARTPSHEQVAYKVEHMKVDDGNLAHVLERRDVGEAGGTSSPVSGIGIAYQRLGADHLVVLIDLGLHVDGHRALCDGFRRAARRNSVPAPDSSQGFQPADRARARICFICLSFSSTSLAMLLTSRQVCCQA